MSGHFEVAILCLGILNSKRGIYGYLDIHNSNYGFGNNMQLILNTNYGYLDIHNSNYGFGHNMHMIHNTNYGYLDIHNSQAVYE